MKIILLLVAMAIQPVSAQRGAMPEPMVRLRENMSGARPARVVRSAGRMSTTVDTSSPAYLLLDAAYAALRDEDLDLAVENFEKAIPLQPERTDIRKDLAYTYLRIGENELGRRQFEKVVELDAKDYRSQLELAFLDYESADRANKVAAWRIFRGLRDIADADLAAVAQQAFAVVDAALGSRIAQWRDAITKDPSNLYAHLQLANALEERNEFVEAERYYRLSLGAGFAITLYELGRTLLAAGKLTDARMFLMEAAKTKDPYVVEAARERLLVLP
ncbi:MAG: hypothetical protein NTZ56_14175 [Acidobacteria bacterium]|nr:hypothetical protein [Acidobacteriota bacterium]